MAEHGHTVLCFGPPGTGKTTWLGGRVKGTVKARGSDSVMITSFSRAAAREVKGRHLPIPSGAVGTLHSMAYRSVGRPQFYGEEVDDWNARNPGWALGGGGQRSLDDVAEQGPALADGDGPRLHAETDILRAKMIPFAEWSFECQAFYDRWSEWKRDADVVDYTDMLEMALEQTERAPGNPEVIFADEQQDATPLELALLTKWGASADRVIQCLDDDQAVYRFRGAVPGALIDSDVPEADRIHLSQSWRIPAAVHEAATRWVTTIGHREPKEYQPRDAEGKISFPLYSIADASSVVREIERHTDDGRSVMVLASCSYMLGGVLRALRARGLPFSNPWKENRGDWNPIQRSSEAKTAAADRLLAYLILDERIFGDGSRPWTAKDLATWMAVVKSSGVFRRGAKKMVADYPQGHTLDYDEVAALFVDDDELTRAVEPSIDWFKAHLTAAGAKSLAYPMAIFNRAGAEGLQAEPLIHPGTIHSVKGAEADVVILSPDLSRAAGREWAAGDDGADAVKRLMYVGMTRAREELVVLAPGAMDYAPVREVVATR